MDEHWRVVIADDSPEDRAAVRRLLQQAANRRYEFVEADSGEDAITACREALVGTPNVVVLDYQLPDMDAFDVLARLRDDDGHTICPVVVLTGAVNHTRARAFVRAGAHDYVGKSWLTPDSLARGLDNAVERWALVRELHTTERRLSLAQRVAGPGTSDRNLDTELVRDAEGRATRLTGTVEDIAERKRAEQSLRAREQRLRLALRAGKTGVWEWSFSEDSVIWSDETCSIFGFRPGEFAGTLAAFEQVIHPEDREGVLRQVRLALAEETEYAYEFRIVRRDGQVRRVTNLGLLQRDESGVPRSLIGTVTDVTEQREAEEKLRNAERELRLVAENTPDIIARFDRQLRHVYVNGAVERATGRPRASFLDKTNREIGMPDALCDRWDAAIQQVFRTAQACSLDFEFESPEGSKHFEAHIVPELGPLGTVEHVLTVTHDVTARVKAEERLRDNDRRKDVFLATLAHELRNPLAPIRIGLELLSSRGAPAAQERTIAMMNRQVTQMVHLIDDLLDISRISSGKVVLKRERICLQETVVAALESSRPVIDAAKHTLQVEQPVEPIWLDADATRVTQVISNLLTNAAKYTPNGGRVSLKTGLANGHAEIEVSDNGVGIPPAYLDRIFDMFAQVNSSLQRSQGGLGIGLALVKRLIEMHGGTVFVASPGERLGSTFTVRLPLVAAELEPAELARDHAPRRDD